MSDYKPPKIQKPSESNPSSNRIVDSIEKTNALLMEVIRVQNQLLDAVRSITG